MTKPWAPTPRQEAALAWLRGKPRALAVIPTGGGKTAVTLHLLAEGIAAGTVGRVLIVAPKLLVEKDQWRKEAAKWSGTAHLADEFRTIGFEDLDLTTAPGGHTFKDKTATRARLLALPGRIWVVSWHAWQHLEEVLGPKWQHSTVVMDESSNLVAWSSARSRAARRLLVRGGRVDRLLLLSATPADNHSPDIANQLALLAPQRVKTLTDFRARFCEPDKTDRRTGLVYSWRLRADARAEFDALLAEVAMSVEPEREAEVDYVEHPVPLPDDAAALYRRLKRDQVAEIDGGTVTCGSAAVLRAKLLQVCLGTVLDDDGVPRRAHTARHEALAALLDGLGEEAAVVAYQHIADRDQLRAAGHPDVRDKGGMESFMAGMDRTLTLHLRSASHGLDGLQRVARHVVFLAPSDDLELTRQVIGRLTRPGQTQRVVVHVLFTPGTVEEDILRDVLPGKTRRSQQLERSVRVEAATR